MSLRDLDAILRKLSDPNQKRKFEILQNELGPLLFDSKPQLKLDSSSKIEMLIIGHQNDSDDEEEDSESEDSEEEKSK